MINRSRIQKMQVTLFQKKRTAIILCAAALAVLAGVLTAILSSPSKDIAFVQKMKPGWNLGNTLDAHGLKDPEAVPEKYETYWGNPFTTAEMIAKVKEAGFNTIRIPVTWYEHMDKAYHIDDAWMDRVQQVADYGIQNGLYVILNAHHDAWYTPDPANLKKAETVMRAVWGQIAVRFAGYDEHLLFEGMNEPRLIGTEHEWDEGTPEAREAVNKLNEAFVETIRASGGKNGERYLLIPTYCASTRPEALKALVLPKGGRLIVSIHLYRPYDFTLNEAGTAEWSPNSREDTEEIDQAIEDARHLFTDRGIPVIITEFGTVDKGNTAARTQWADYVTQKAGAAHIGCIWWDNSIYDRCTLQWKYPDIVHALTGK